MKKTMLAAAALALLASPSLRAMDDWERRVNIHPDTLIRGVSIPSAFKGLDGKTQPAGIYDLRLQKGTQGILIGLLRNGKTVGEFPGKFVPGAADPPGGATQGHDISIRKTGDGSVKPGQAQMQDFHFDVSSKVSFGGGGGAGKISCSNNLHPGGANVGRIEFQMPPGPPSAK